jgi:UPF0755 protein
MALILIISTLSACASTNLNSKSKTTTAPNTVSVTFPEGYTIIDIAKKLEANGVCSADSFMQVCNQPYDGITIDNANERVFLLEGYIFPDTYEFYLNSDAKTVLDKFIANYNSKVTDDIKAKAEALGYTMDEMLTLASIIQKECDKDTAECANVSSVFHNRLKSSSFPKLQSDVTTFYIKNDLGEYLGYQADTELTKQNEKVQYYMNLYSTYYCKGLPAGPICNPGIKAINAAVNPADTNYLYFLTDASGEHFYYAATLAEHQANGKKAGVY